MSGKPRFAAQSKFVFPLVLLLDAVVLGDDSASADAVMAAHGTFFAKDH